MPKATPQGAPEGPGRADVPRRACQAARIRELVDRFESVPSATSSTAQDQALGSQRKAPQGARRASLPPSMPSGTGGATTSRSVSGPSSQLPGRAFSIAVGSRNDPPLEEEDIVVASPLDTAGGDGPSPSERSGAEPQQRPHVEAALGRMDWSPRYGLGQSFQDEPGKPRGVDHAKASSPGSPATPLASNTRSMFLPSNRDAREAGHTSSRALSSAFFTGQRQTQVHAHSMPLRSVDPQPVKERQQAQLDKSQAAQRRAEEREQRNAPSHLPVTQVRVQSDALPFDPVSARLVKPSARPVHAHGTPAIGNIPIELRGAERPYKVRLPSSGEDSPFSRFRDETGGDWLEGARRRPVQQGRPTDRQPTHAESRPEISAKSGVRDGLPASGEKLPFSLGKGRKDGLKGATGQTTAGLPDRGDSSSAGSEVSPNRHSLPEDHPKDPFADQDGDATGKPQAPSTYPLAESATGADRFSPPGRKHMLDFDSTLKYRPSDDLDSSPSPGCSLGRSTVDTPCEGMYQEEDEEGLPFFDRGSTSPSSRGADERSSETLCLRPAAEVFGAKAAPLHLPALDAYLSDKKRFPEPRFTDPRLLCTLEERMLFGYDAQPEATGRQGKRKIAKLEVVGGQIKAPAYALLDTKTGPKSSRSAVGPKAKRDQGQEEVEEVEEEEEAKASLVEPNSISTLTGVTGSTGVSSSFSSASKPATRLEMFPPLMLLRDHSLDELKSNAVGPRAPPGGMLGSLPPLGSILGTVLDFLIGIEGSSFAAGIVRLEVFRDFAQMMALNLHFNSATSASDSLVRRIFLHIIPSLLAFDFVSVFGQSIIFLCAWMALTGLALWYFWRMTRVYDPNRDVEGFESQPWIFTSPARGTKAANITIVFILTSLYLPLSKLAVDALLWKSDFWPVANPYADGNDNPDQSSLPSLGDPDVYRGPLDFCYTTTMRRDAFNFAWIVVPLAVLTLCGYTLWFPYRMWRTVHEMLPHVSEYNELGQRRSSNEMEIEYQRLLGRDKSPLNFFYNVYRRQWGGYKSIYMLCFKLTNLLVITTFAKDNCLFRTKPTKTMLIVQQSVLIVLMSLLLGIHLWLKPFIDALSNRSEMVSRWGYVCTAVIGLLVALRVSGSSVYNTTILYLVQGVTYAGNIYLALAGTSLLQHFVKRMQKRIDFSVDIFSPAIDLSKHIKRRIWEETFSTILLSGPSYHMPIGQLVAFSQSDIDRWPPYLLNFEGSVAERHVENIKIVKEIGLDEYRAAVEYERGHMSHRLRQAVFTIQTRFAGPDAHWRPIRPPYPSGVSSWFGKAFLVPFPPTLVMRYDQGAASTIQLTTLEELEAFVTQNDSEEVQSRRMVRHALRALDGQQIFCPHVETVQVGTRHSKVWETARATFSSGHSYTLATPVSYMDGVLSVRHREDLHWEGYNFASGFDVFVTFTDGRRQDPDGTTRVGEPLTISASAAFGLTDDFRMTSSLIRLLRDNEALVRDRVPPIVSLMQQYREDFYKEAREKAHVLSYAFFVDIFNSPKLSRQELTQALARSSCCRAVRQLPQRYSGTVTLLYERLEAVNRSPVHQWWWLLWDDLYRKNAQDVKQLRRHRRSFSPHYPSSIAYRPMARPELERWLAERNLWIQGGQAGFLNGGLLNRIYFYLDEIVFANQPANSVPLALGSSLEGAQLHSFGTLDASAPASSVLTGGGTDHDVESIIDRNAYRWEQRMFGRPALTLSQRIWDNAMEWLNLQPFKSDPRRKSLFLYLRLVDGKYELAGPEDRAPDHDEALDTSSTARGNGIPMRRLAN